MNQQQREELKQTLVEAKFMTADDMIMEDVAGDVYKSFLDGQCRGHYYFTQQRIVFISGFGVNSFAIPYANIKEIKKSFIGPLMPFGITVSFDNEEGKVSKYKFSLLGRNKWLDYITQRAGR